LDVKKHEGKDVIFRTDIAKVVTDLFLAYNRDPARNKPLVENYCEKFDDMEITILERVVDELKSASSTLPRYPEVIYAYQRTASRERPEEYIECDSCNGSGMIIGITCGGEKIISVNYPAKGRAYATAVVGRCDCKNGVKYQRSLFLVDVPGFIRQYAARKDIDCAYAAGDLCKRLNRGEFEH